MKDSHKYYNALQFRINVLTLANKEQYVSYKVYKIVGNMYKEICIFYESFIVSDVFSSNNGSATIRKSCQLLWIRHVRQISKYFVTPLAYDNYLDISSFI